MEPMKEPEVTGELVGLVVAVARLSETKPVERTEWMGFARERVERMTYCTTACQQAIAGWDRWPDHTQRALLNRVYQAVFKTREAPWRG